jgi:hypothetical protein
MFEMYRDCISHPLAALRQKRRVPPNAASLMWPTLPCAGLTVNAMQVTLDSFVTHEVNV